MSIRVEEVTAEERARRINALRISIRLARDEMAGGGLSRNRYAHLRSVVAEARRALSRLEKDAR